MIFNLQMRDYQTDIVEQVRAAYREGAVAPLLQLATGAGKTVIASYIMAASSHRGNTTLFLVHRKELIKQTSRTLTQAGVAHGIIHPEWPSTAHRLQVASVQTLSRRLHRYQRFDFIVVDEAHHATAGTWRKIFEAYPDAYLLGLTATPTRTDGKGLGTNAGGFFDKMISGPSMSELIAAGFLAKPKVFVSPMHIDLSQLGVRAGDYRQEQAAELMSNRTIVGDAVRHYKKHLDGKRAIAFCASVGHAHEVALQFRHSGVESTWVDGGMKAHDRDAAISNFAAGRIKVLTSCDLISEGFDVPACDGALLLRPTQSESLYLQMVGRPLRTSPDKPFAVILDHVGNVSRHGLPDDEREWSLDGRAHRQNEPPPDTVTCPQCYAVWRAGTMRCEECECDISPEAMRARNPSARAESEAIQQQEGDLIEMTPEMIAVRREQQRREVSAARTRDDLMQIALQRGYNPRWVDHVMRSRERR